MIREANIRGGREGRAGRVAKLLPPPVSPDKVYAGGSVLDPASPMGMSGSSSMGRSYHRSTSSGSSGSSGGNVMMEEK